MLFLHTTFFTIVVVFLSERVRATPARPAAAATTAATASAAAGSPACGQAQVQEQGEAGETRQDG